MMLRELALCLFSRKPGGFKPSMLFGASVWIKDRYLIVPLNWILDHCLIGVLPAS